MKKPYLGMEAELIQFQYEDIITASGGPYTGHYDANGKYHPNGNGNKHVGGVNFDGPNGGRGI